MSACYVGSNWPVTLLLAYKYPVSLEEALLAGANAGGENTNRNALLGTILGAALGGSPEGWREVEKWREGLRAVDELEGEIDTFVEEVLHSQSRGHARRRRQR
ncbi:unnamed protein product [Prorocentrum cordatum]|nr:unnamed protein product [Polarella glacialis]